MSKSFDWEEIHIKFCIGFGFRLLKTSHILFVCMIFHYWENIWRYWVHLQYKTETLITDPLLGLSIWWNIIITCTPGIDTNSFISIFSLTMDSLVLLHYRSTGPVQNIEWSFSWQALPGWARTAEWELWPICKSTWQLEPLQEQWRGRQKLRSAKWQFKLNVRFVVRIY